MKMTLLSNIFHFGILFDLVVLAKLMYGPIVASNAMFKILKLF